MKDPVTTVSVSAGEEPVSAGSLEIGQAFNPYKHFRCIWIPEDLVSSRQISQGAKIAYGQLSRYAGKNGNCFPAVDTLARQIGVGPRQAQNYLSQLERAKLILRRERHFGSSQRSNTIDFLWHEIFQTRTNGRSERQVNERSPESVHHRSPKESQCKESQAEESNVKQTGDPDYAPTHRSEPALSSTALCREYPRLREALAVYMMIDSDDEKVYPTPRHVVDVMHAVPGATEDEVLGCLIYLREERGLRRGTRTGPRHFSWFAKVIRDHFRRYREL